MYVYIYICACVCVCAQVYQKLCKKACTYVGVYIYGTLSLSLFLSLFLYIYIYMVTPPKDLHLQASYHLKLVFTYVYTSHKYRNYRKYRCISLLPSNAYSLAAKHLVSIYR